MTSTKPSRILEENPYPKMEKDASVGRISIGTSVTNERYAARGGEGWKRRAEIRERGRKRKRTTCAISGNFVAIYGGALDEGRLEGDSPPRTVGGSRGGGLVGSRLSRPNAKADRERETTRGPTAQLSSSTAISIRRQLLLWKRPHGLFPQGR